MQAYHSPLHLVEPSAQFTQRVMNAAVGIEKQRRTRIAVWFALLAIAPYAVRQLWSFIRGDFISVASLPFGHALSEAYLAFMSSTATYVLLAFGILLAFYIVGLPSWRRREFV